MFTHWIGGGGKPYEIDYIQLYYKVISDVGFYETSDERLKNFIGDIEPDFDKISKIPKKYFKWKNDNSESINIGTSAQKLMELYPCLVSETDGKFNVDYARLSIIALSAIDELYKEIVELKEKIKKLENNE